MELDLDVRNLMSPTRCNKMIKQIIFSTFNIDFYKVYMVNVFAF